MTKEFIPYEQALSLKKLGFDEFCFGIWAAGQLVIWDDISEYPKNVQSLAPLYQQAFRWFREKHTLYHDIKMFGDWDNPQFSYIVSGRTMTNPAHMWYYEDKNSYEEAELACLIKLIEIVKTKII